MQGDNGGERRRFERFGVDWTVHELRPGRTSYKVLDFGAGGIRVDTELKHPDGTLLVLMFDLSDPLRSFVAPARVLSRNDGHESSRLEFLMPQYHLSRVLSEKIN